MNDISVTDAIDLAEGKIVYTKGPMPEGRAAPARTESVPTSDPAPDPIDAARQRAQDLVHNIATNTLLDLGKRRDELDNCMARITTSKEALTRYITEFARFNYEALELSRGIAADIVKATEPFAGTPPATLTQRPGKE